MKAYELALRRELAELHRHGSSTSFIIDIRSSGTQPMDVADKLRAMVRGLGSLHAARTAVVTSGGIAKLQAKRVADPNARVFTSIVLARDWVLGRDMPAGVSPGATFGSVDPPWGVALAKSSGDDPRQHGLARATGGTCRPQPASGRRVETTWTR